MALCEGSQGVCLLTACCFRGLLRLSQGLCVRLTLSAVAHL
ncbi:hypothetical protein HMPREF3185_01126 [Porphyromonas somerae]|uniref:Uncharacterized protein n=1 Tax=Porphyromonas somerae TaxID=322095 RepID=A0A134B8B8_9PORP|nr:hypothetical protein HMPREF3184_01126 [Porphyromonadaceae bacterium KA00676]KXB76189.1 hypothetical protein HMPREF3185_01126 [Porphyromonas somerae]